MTFSASRLFILGMVSKFIVILSLIIIPDYSPIVLGVVHSAYTVAFNQRQVENHRMRGFIIVLLAIIVFCNFLWLLGCNFKAPLTDCPDSWISDAFGLVAIIGDLILMVVVPWRFVNLIRHVNRDQR